MRSGHLFVLFPFVFVAQVAAHGYVKSVSIDGHSYAGNIPYRTPTDSPIRLIDDVDPVMGTSNVNLVCGQGAENAATVVPANPGSKVAFTWVSGNGGNWPHNTGPLMTYMALCEGTTCDKYDATNANWFKIDQAGQKSDGSGWWMMDIMEGKSYTVTVPDEVAPGEYLIRHEIIALQNAASVGGVEFYPSCTQVRVGGNGKGVPSPTVHFPGGYTETDPGLYTPDVYQPGFVYQFPAPALATFSGSGSGSGSSSSSASASASTSSSTGRSSSAAPTESSTAPAESSTAPAESSTSPTESSTATTESSTETSAPTSTVPITHISTSARSSHTVSASHHRSSSHAVSTSHHQSSSHAVSSHAHSSHAASSTHRSSHAISTTQRSSHAVSTSLPSSTAVESTSTAPTSEVESTSTVVPASSTVPVPPASCTSWESCWDPEWEHHWHHTSHPSWPHRMAKVKRSHF
ncbi:glycosyl hydrolase family 61-domain-containing protein [Ganoderma leucocontextum]|nr:glycosyl hydrolase family 61-domain-containing protein [Ganoderma leucocontextum]